MEAQPQSTRDKGGTLVRGALRLAAVVAASAFGHWAGAAFLIPLAGAGAAYYVLRKARPAWPTTAVLLAAVQAGHVCLFLFGLLAPGGWIQVGLDIVILGSLLTWFGMTLSARAAYALLAVQVVSLLLNLVTLASALGSGVLAPLSVHLLFRSVAIYLIASFLVQARRQAALQVFD